jgi:hypothetical protein
VPMQLEREAFIVAGVPGEGGEIGLEEPDGQARRTSDEKVLTLSLERSHNLTEVRMVDYGKEAGQDTG